MRVYGTTADVKSLIFFSLGSVEGTHPPENKITITHTLSKQTRYQIKIFKEYDPHTAFYRRAVRINKNEFCYVLVCPSF